VEYDELIYSEEKFVRYVRDTRYPFLNDVFLVRTGSKIPVGSETGKSTNIINMDKDQRFYKFLVFLKKEFKLDLLDASASDQNNVLTTESARDGGYADASILDGRSSYIEKQRIPLRPPAPARLTHDNMIKELNETMDLTSHHRYHTVLNQYQHHYLKHQNPKPILSAPSHEALKARMFIYNRFFN
jgi:hypothetical protein